MKIICIVFILVLTFGCKRVNERGQNPVVVSLLGKSFYEPGRSAAVQEKLDSNLTEAKANWEKDASEENYIWYGRRLGYLSRFQEAIDIFTDGIQKYPASAKLYRHRGHRFISLRLFDRAIDDLNKAISLISGFPPEIEPDGIPNSISTPLSTTQFNITYHLGLAHYLKGDFARAHEAYIGCLKFCNNDDLLVACVDWMYMNYRRQGRDIDAKSILDSVLDSMNIIENDSYYKRCRMYQGKISPDSLLSVGVEGKDADLVMATQGYGVGNWYLCNGDSVKAKDVFEKVVAGKNFSAFGFIAAEADLARWEK